MPLPHHPGRPGLGWGEPGLASDASLRGHCRIARWLTISACIGRVRVPLGGRSVNHFGPLGVLDPLPGARTVGALGPGLVCGRPGVRGRSRGRALVVGWTLAVGSVRRARSRSRNFIRRRSNGGSFVKRFATTDGIRRDAAASSGIRPGASAREDCSASTTNGFSIAPHGGAPRSTSRRSPPRADIDRPRRRGEFSGLRHRYGSIAANARSIHAACSPTGAT